MTLDIPMTQKPVPLVDLIHGYPRSPRETLGDFVILPRLIDKCRATLNGTNGEYHYNHPNTMDQVFFHYFGIDGKALQDFIATGAEDQQILIWILQHSRVQDREHIVQWSNRARATRLSDLDPQIQLTLNDYIQSNLPKGAVIYYAFDVHDIEERRLQAHLWDIKQHQKSEPKEHQAKDLSVRFPRSPRETLGDFIILPRMIDKCRALLNGSVGPYKFNGGMDRALFDFTQVDAEAFKTFVATGADDDAILEWFQSASAVKDRQAIIQWGNQLRDMTISDLPADKQVYLEDYIHAHIPKGRVIYRWFDLYDIEEKRI